MAAFLGGEQRSLGCVARCGLHGIEVTGDGDDQKADEDDKGKDGAKHDVSNHFCRNARIFRMPVEPIGFPATEVQTRAGPAVASACG